MKTSNNCYGIYLIYLVNIVIPFKCCSTDNIIFSFAIFVHKLQNFFPVHFQNLPHLTYSHPNRSFFFLKILACPLFLLFLCHFHVFSILNCFFIFFLPFSSLLLAIPDASLWSLFTMCPIRNVSFENIKIKRLSLKNGYQFISPKPGIESEEVGSVWSNFPNPICFLCASPSCESIVLSSDCQKYGAESSEDVNKERNNQGLKIIKMSKR